MYDFLLLVNFGRVCYTVFEILTHKAIKWLILPPHPCLAPRWGNPLEFLDETYPTKTRGMGLPYGENFVIRSPTVFKLI